ncbi:hypothetical protein CEXT_623901 [Caerostris extrusa]|uniref:Uncharacterized protein n=1 Tax=Caerostris extrusa TaxID=172846 RepID=A0AAV4MF28_CAEEX|nr:hypothetical protein CEXT_623901 [Caerostris extrusa]
MITLRDYRTPVEIIAQSSSVVKLPARPLRSKAKGPCTWPGALDEAQRRRKKPTDRSPPDTLQATALPIPLMSGQLAAARSHRPFASRPYVNLFTVGVCYQNLAHRYVYERAFVHALKASS